MALSALSDAEKIAILSADNVHLRNEVSRVHKEVALVKATLDVSMRVFSKMKDERDDLKQKLHRSENERIQLEAGNQISREQLQLRDDRLRADEARLSVEKNAGLNAIAEKNTEIETLNHRIVDLDQQNEELSQTQACQDDCLDNCGNAAWTFAWYIGYSIHAAAHEVHMAANKCLGI